MLYKVFNGNLDLYKKGLNIDNRFNFNGDTHYTTKEKVFQRAMQLKCFLVADVVFDGKKKFLSNIRTLQSFMDSLTYNEMVEVVRKDRRALQYVKEQTLRDAVN